MHRAHVITVSDGVSAGTRTDKSGAALRQLLERDRFEVTGPDVVPDEQSHITDAIVAAVVAGADVVVTTGGTGLGPRDVTPQATSMLVDYEVPGSAKGATESMEALLPVIGHAIQLLHGHTKHE